MVSSGVPWGPLVSRGAGGPVLCNMLYYAMLATVRSILRSMVRPIVRSIVRWRVGSIVRSIMRLLVSSIKRSIVRSMVRSIEIDNGIDCARRTVRSIARSIE